MLFIPVEFLTARKIILSYRVAKISLIVSAIRYDGTILRAVKNSTGSQLSLLEVTLGN